MLTEHLARWRVPALACAVDRALVQELDRLLKQAGAGPSSIEPYPAAATNLWRRELTAEAFWLVLLEPGRLWLGRAEQGLGINRPQPLLGGVERAGGRAGFGHSRDSSGGLRPPLADT